VGDVLDHAMRRRPRWRAAHRLVGLDTGAPLLLDDEDPLRFPGVPERPLGLTAGDPHWWEVTAREAAGC
jgi:hypothetical protein